MSIGHDYIGSYQEFSCAKLLFTEDLAMSNYVATTYNGKCAKHAALNGLAIIHNDTTGGETQGGQRGLQPPHNFNRGGRAPPHLAPAGHFLQ